LRIVRFLLVLGEHRKRGRQPVVGPAALPPHCRPGVATLHQNLPVILISVIEITIM